LHAFWCCKPFLYGTKKWAIVQKGNWKKFYCRDKIYVTDWNMRQLLQIS
jgi:hypothetical protein